MLSSLKRRLSGGSQGSYKSGLKASDITKAYYRIKSIVNKSPLDYSPLLSKEFNADIFLKKEHISLTGSYKERGALNKLLLLNEEEKKKGVICSSAGNHAQAVSHHATRLGIDAIIVMPETTPYIKVKMTQRFGGKVLLHGENYDDAYSKAIEISEKEGRTFVHAFNDPEVVAGQGTVALEILEENPFLDAVVVPIGGGGLIAGVALALHHINPRIQVYGVEAARVPKMTISLKENQVTKVPKLRTIADGIAVQQPGNVCFEVIQDLVENIVLVEEDEIASAILTLLEVEKTVVEGSGATGIAAISSGKLNFQGQKVAVILTGGNIDMTALGRIIEKGLVKDGRLARIQVIVEDIPGELAKLATVIASTRANIRDIVHERAFLPSSVAVHHTSNIFTLETRGPQHIEHIKKTLTEKGYKYVDMG